MNEPRRAGEREIAFTPGQIREGVIGAIADALDIVASEVPTDASLAEDLDAESLDYLDIAFRLEDRFRIRMPQRNVLQRAEKHFGERSLVKAGQVTELGLEVLRRAMPEVDPGRFRPGLHVFDVGRMLTTETFIRVVTRLLEGRRELPRECKECGGELVESTSALELVCSKCSASSPLPDGDQLLFEDIAAYGL